MVDGVNDSDRQADLLAALLKGQPGHVNLIPLNHVAESPLKPSKRIRQFQQRLESHGVTATVRLQAGWRYRRILWPTPAEASPRSAKKPRAERIPYHESMGRYGHRSREE